MMKTSLSIVLILTTSGIALSQTQDTTKRADTTKLTKDIDLKEVTIRARKPLIKMEVDRTVVDPSAMISTSGSNTLEVLERTPGVTVNASGAIKLNGQSGIMVLIDGRQTYLSGGDLTNYLKSIPGATLDKIELIDNPPARYDAGGNAIINIKLKKNRAAGFNGGLSTGFNQGLHGRSNHSVNVNYNRRKLNVFSNLGYSTEKNYSDNTFDRHFYSANSPSSRILLNNDQISRGAGINLNLGADYSATAQTTFGFQLNVNDNDREEDLRTATNTFPSQGLNVLGSERTNSESTNANWSANLNVLHKSEKSGSEFSADINYLSYGSDGSQHQQNQFNQMPTSMNIYTAKVDYLLPMGKDAKLEAGAKTSYVNNDKAASYYRYEDAHWLTDDTRTNHFQYQEQISAAYFLAQKSWSRLAIQAGLRAEHTYAEGTQLGNQSVAASAFRKDYLQLFPSLFISYELDSVSRNSFTFGFTRRINRPSYNRLNPFLFFRDQYSYSTGNSDLDPQHQYRYELKYKYKQLLRVSLSYNHFRNVIFETTNVANNVYVTAPENVNRGYMVLLNTGLSLSPAKWWQVHTDVLLSKMGLRGQSYGQPLNPDTYVARINVMNQYAMAKGWSAELGGYYASRDLNGQSFTSGMIRINAGIQKKLLNDKASLRLYMDDIFHSWIYHNRSISLKDAYYDQTIEYDTQRVGLSFSYNFGNELFARKGRRKSNAQEEEKNRLK